LLFDLHCERQAVFDFDGENFLLAKLGDCFEHFGRLLLEPEVREDGFTTRAVFTADLELSHYSWRGFERWLARYYPQAFDPAEVQILEQLNKATLRC